MSDKLPDKFTKEQILNKKLLDYGFIIAFFLIFSFFIFFAIKPNLETAFKLQKELEELRKIDDNYNEAIDTILKVQSALEGHRDDVPLLNQALPPNPQVNKIIADIQSSASSSGIPLTRLNVQEVPIKTPSLDKNMKNYIITFESTSEFDSVQRFVAGFLSQRRLKLINNLELSKDAQVGSESAQLRVAFEIEGFYL